MLNPVLQNFSSNSNLMSLTEEAPRTLKDSNKLLNSGPALTPAKPDVTLASFVISWMVGRHTL